MGEWRMTRRQRAIQAVTSGQPTLSRKDADARHALRIADAVFGPTRRVRGPLKPCRVCRSPFVCGHR